MVRQAIAVAWGAGWDSTAMLIRDVQLNRPISLVTFADHGGEKRYPDPEAGEEIGTYEFLDVFSDWLEAEGYPRPIRCRYSPKVKTNERYYNAVRLLVRDLELESEIDESAIQRLGGIYGNCVANETLPSLAFSIKACSIKWKLEAQEPI